MNEVNEYVSKLSAFIPEFKELWESDVCGDNFGNDSTVHRVFSAFSDVVGDRLMDEKLHNTEQIFNFVESVVVDGGNPSNAACTCFLENLINRGVNPDFFVSFMGPESTKYCKAWDEFTGVKTRGL